MFLSPRFSMIASWTLSFHLYPLPVPQIMLKQILDIPLLCFPETKPPEFCQWGGGTLNSHFFSSSFHCCPYFSILYPLLFEYLAPPVLGLVRILWFKSVEFSAFPASGLGFRFLESAESVTTYSSPSQIWHHHLLPSFSVRNGFVIKRKSRGCGVLLWHSRLRIWHCHCNSLGLIPGLGTSTCHKCIKKKRRRRERKKKKKKQGSSHCGLMGWAASPQH